MKIQGGRWYYSNRYWVNEFKKIDTIESTDKLFTIQWSGNCSKDYFYLSNSYYRCADLIVSTIFENPDDNIQTDSWFLPAIFLFRHSIELGIKSLVFRYYTTKKAQDIFVQCCHNIYLIFTDYLKSQKLLLSEVELDWLEKYLFSIESIDSRSDLFRFPFDPNDRDLFNHKSIDIVETTNNVNQAYWLIIKMWHKGEEIEGFCFDNSKSSCFLIENHSGFYCYLWESLSDYGFHMKTMGYVETAELLYRSDISVNEKFYPIMFLLRNSLELCLKRVFFCSLEHGVPRLKFNKRRSHKIKKELWKYAAPVIKYYASESGEDIKVVEDVERMLYEIDALDQNGDAFRYPTTYSCEYKLQGKVFDFDFIFGYYRGVVSVIGACGDMLTNISDYEAEMYASME